MIIKFTNQGTIRNFKHFAETLDFEQPDSLQIALASRWINVHPAHLALAAALALKVGRQHATITGEAPSSARYLDRMGLYQFTSTASPFGDYSHREPAGRFVPLTIIQTTADQSKFIADMVPLLHLKERDASIIKYVLGELVRNVLEHSYSPNGAIVAAQYYKKTNRISLAICDTGIGLWRSLQLWHPRTDKDALELALMPGISGTTTREGGSAENAGAGLFFIKSIAKITRGYFTIYSGNTSYIMLKTRTDQKSPMLYANPFSDRHIITEGAPRFDGTLVAVDIPLDSTSEFRNLLDQIGQIYDDAIRQRREAKYRKPNFI